MAKPFVPWSKAKCEQELARRAAQRAETDRCIVAGIDALKQGGDLAAAMDAVRDRPRRTTAAEAAPDLTPLLQTHRLRVDGWTVEMQRDFLRTLADTGCVSHAAKAAGVSRSTAYAMRHRATHSTFALAWDVAIQLGRKRLLDIAMERAIEGQEVAIWYRGEQVGTRTVFNDRLLTFLIGHTPPPAHAALDPEELAAIFPRLLDTVDRLLPHPLAMRLAADRAAEAAAQAEEEEGDN